MRGVVRENDPNALEEYGEYLHLTDQWPRHVLKKMQWTKRKGTAGTVEPSPQLQAEEQFTFQRATSTTVLKYDTSLSLVLNLDQTPLSYVSSRKCTFSFKWAIRRVFDKRQITGTCAVTLTGKLLSIQLVCKRKTKRSLQKFRYFNFFFNHLYCTKNEVFH